MRPYEVAQWLANGCTDEEFVEVFAYYEKMQIHDNYERFLSINDIRKFNIRETTDKIYDIINEVVNGDCNNGAWFKKEV